MRSGSEPENIREAPERRLPDLPEGTARHLAIFCGVYVLYLLALYLPVLPDLPQPAKLTLPGAAALAATAAGGYLRGIETRGWWRYVPPLLVVSTSSLWYGLSYYYDMSAGAVALYLANALLVALIEETLFRGELLSLAGRNPAGILITSAVFGVSHLLNLIGGTSLVNVLMQVWYAAVIGVLLGTAAVKTGSLYLPVLFHGLFNFISSYSNIFNYVPATRVIINSALTVICLYAFAVSFPEERRLLARRLAREKAEVKTPPAEPEGEKEEVKEE